MGRGRLGKGSCLRHVECRLERGELELFLPSLGSVGRRLWSHYLDVNRAAWFVLWSKTYPSAIVITKAFSKDSFVKSLLGVISCSIQILIASAALTHSRILAGDSAGFEEDPGSERPIASIAVDIVLAVYIPPHAPAPGQECCWMSSITSLGVRPGSPGRSAACKRLYVSAPAAS